MFSHLSASLPQLLEWVGYPGLLFAVFAESGFLLGAILPGDSLLFTAGLLASQGYFNIFGIFALAIAGAIAGDSFGYWCGRRFGPKIFSREDSFFFHKKFVTKTEAFYAKHGKKTIILARFMPIVRTFAPILAGVGGMPYRIFSFYNVIGAALWGGGLTLAGYFLGSAFPATEHYLSLIILGIIIVSFIPIIFEFIKEYRHA